MNPPPAEPTASRTVFSGRLLEVRVELWPAGEREVVHHPGACAVVALTPSGDVVLVRQFREAAREWLLEIPAGLRDIDGESVEDCAARELLEETGYRAVSIEPLGSILTSPGFADERIELFLAQTGDAPSALPTEEGIEVALMPLAEAIARAADGRIADAKTMVALHLVRERIAGPTQSRTHHT